MQTNENTTMGKMMQVLSHIHAEDRETKGKTVKCNEIARFYGKGDRFFEGTCYALVKKGWIEASMGSHGGYSIGSRARKEGPIGLINDFVHANDKWLIDLMLKKSKKAFADFRPELVKISKA